MGSIPIGHINNFLLLYIVETSAVCPGGEGAVLKTVGLKRWQGPSGTCYATNRPSRQARLAGSNPVCGDYRWMSRIGNAADCKSVASALGVQVPLHLL